MIALFRKTISAAALSILLTGPGWATTLTFDTFASTDDFDTLPTVTVNDDTADVFTFNISIPNVNAFLSAVFIDFSGSLPFSGTDIASLTAGVTVEDFAINTNDIGNGRNLSGGFGDPINGGSGLFDIGFGFDDEDRNGGAARQTDLPFSFTVSDLGSLALGDIERIGLRFQSVGEAGQDGLGGDSEKLVSVLTPPSPVPLPAAGWLLLLGVAGLGLTRRLKGSVG